MIAGGLASLQAQTTVGRGGGVYMEDGAKLVGTLVCGNRAEEGFGIGGGNAVVINCTVAGNAKLQGSQENIQPGFIYCADGRIVAKEEFEAGTMEAVGVVFWVNSDVFSLIRGYVVALRQEKKTWDGPSYSEGIEMPPISDTAAYRNTKLLEVSEAARYCREYVPGVSGRQWVLPAAYQLAALFYAWTAVEDTLEFLKGQGKQVDDLQEEIYWSSTEDLEGAWAVDFASGEYISQEWDESCCVRPVFAY